MIKTDIALRSLIQQTGQGELTRKTVTYTGAVSYSVFTVTGCVVAKVIGYITTGLTDHGDATKVGTATDDDCFIASTTGANAKNATTVWVDAGPTKLETFPTASYIIGNGEDIVVTSTANITGGVVEFYCFWKPLSSDGKVVAA